MYVVLLLDDCFHLFQERRTSFPRFRCAESWSFLFLAGFATVFFCSTWPLLSFGQNDHGSPGAAENLRRRTCPTFPTFTSGLFLTSSQFCLGRCLFMLLELLASGFKKVSRSSWRSARGLVVSTRFPTNDVCRENTFSLNLQN